MNLDDLFQILHNQGASDLHLKPGSAPTMRLHGQLIAMEGYDELTGSEMTTALESITTPAQREALHESKELDFSHQSAIGSRFRVNASYQQGALSLAFRRVALKIPTIDELLLPEICKELALKRQGLILVTGPTGSGKSTTLAAMVDHLNQFEARRVVTVEDPIEYLYQDKKCYITQRELGRDTLSFATATKHALRQDPDVILVGEMRDPETIAACITAAETGHLVLSTLHTNSAPQTIDRIIDSFPPHQQNQIRMQLSLTLLAVLSQALLPRVTGAGRVPAVEVMIATPAIRNLVREGKTHQMESVIQTGLEHSMQTKERALQDLYQRGLISLDDAIAYASDQDRMRATLA